MIPIRSRHCDLSIVSQMFYRRRPSVKLWLVQTTEACFCIAHSCDTHRLFLLCSVLVFAGVEILAMNEKDEVSLGAVPEDYPRRLPGFRPRSVGFHARAGGSVSDCLFASMGWLKTRDWKTRHQIAGVENARPENPAPTRKDGKRRNKLYGQPMGQFLQLIEITVSLIL